MVTRDMFYFADVDEKFIINTKDIENLEKEEYDDYLKRFLNS